PEIDADDPDRLRPLAPDDEPRELPDVDRRTEQGRPVEVRVTRVERDAAARRVRAQLAGESRESGRTGRGRDARAVEADADRVLEAVAAPLRRERESGHVAAGRKLEPPPRPL